MDLDWTSTVVFVILCVEHVEALESRGDKSEKKWGQSEESLLRRSYEESHAARGNNADRRLEG